MPKIAQNGSICPTPYKYNGGQVYKSDSNLSISVDWFQIITHGFVPNICPDDLSDSYNFGDVVLVANEHLKNGTKHYRTGYDVLYMGELFAQLLLFPRSKVLASDSGSLKVYNNILYQKGWVVRLEMILNSLDLRMNNITRLDIAVDGAELFEDWNRYEQGEYLISGRAETNVYRSADRSIKQFNVGSRKSDKMVVGYNKSKELRSGKDKNKTYISEHWKMFDVDTSKDVHRLELRLRNKAIKSIVDFDISQLENAKYLSGVMRSQMANYFEYRLNNTTDSNKRRSEKIQPIDWDKLNYMEVNKQVKTMKPNSIWSAQRYLTHGLREVHAGIEDGKDLFDSSEWKRLNDKAIGYGLQEWWTRLNEIIIKRDRVIISEMRYKHKEYMATGKTFSDYK